MFARSHRRRAHYGGLEITRDNDPFRIRPDRSLTAGPLTHADLVRQADQLRQQGIIPSPTIQMKEVPLASFTLTLAQPGWFPEAIVLDLGQSYPPGYIMYVVVMDWEVGELPSHNLRVTNSFGTSTELTQNTMKPAVFVLWIFAGASMPHANRYSFCLFHRVGTDFTQPPSSRTLAITQPVVLEVLPYLSQAGSPITVSIYGQLAKATG
jgi:hypothetical protein